MTKRIITQNMKDVYNALATLEGKRGFAYDVLEALEGDRTFSSVNATLSALATKGLLSKEKAVYQNTKMLTLYTVIAELPTEK